MSRRFEGRRALVTGASRGIGAAVAVRLAAEGAHVAIVARTLEEHDHLTGSLAETADRIGHGGGRAAPLVADLNDPTDRERIVPGAVEALGGPIDVVVNNAAAALYGPVASMPLKRRRILFEVNALAPLDLAQAVIPGMIERGTGWIVNLTSAAARPGPSPTMTLYGASKAALNRITTGLAAELTGRICVSLDLIAELGLTVYDLDGATSAAV
jgi:NAD(P)-dependent dehydrogenase (short-subunit alcohol dehydrogenase family)